MANEIILPIMGALLDPTSPPGFKVENTGAKLLFDAAVNELCYFRFRMPDNYASSPELRLQYAMAGATSGDIVMAAAVSAITPGDTANVDSKGLDSYNIVPDTVPATTAGKVKELAIPLTNNDSLAPGDLVKIALLRFASSGSDTASGDLELLSVSLKYS